MADESTLTASQRTNLDKLKAAKGQPVAIPNVVGAKLVALGFAESAKGSDVKGTRGYAPFKLKV